MATKLESLKLYCSGGSVILKKSFPFAILGALFLSGCSGSQGYTVSDKDVTPYVVKVAGDNQTITAGQILPIRFTIQLRQDRGQISSWNLHPVTFTAPSSGVGGEFIDDGLPNVNFPTASRQTVEVLSGPDGVVSSPRFQTNASTGTYEVQAKGFVSTFYADKPGSVKFTATNN